MDTSTLQSHFEHKNCFGRRQFHATQHTEESSRANPGQKFEVWIVSTPESLLNHAFHCFSRKSRTGIASSGQNQYFSIAAFNAMFLLFRKHKPILSGIDLDRIPGCVCPCQQFIRQCVLQPLLDDSL